MKETFCYLFLYTIFALYDCQILLQMSSLIRTTSSYRVLLLFPLRRSHALTNNQLGGQIDFVVVLIHNGAVGGRFTVAGLVVVLLRLVVQLY